jgi:ABC-2 type transport system permease protein
LSGIVISVIGVALMIITSYIILRPEIGLIIIALFMSTLGIIFSAETGILMDLFFPKLNWDTEQKAVKQNLNAMFNMFLCMALGGLVVFIVVKLSLELISAALFIFIVFGTLDYILYRIVMTVGVNRLKQIEN